MPQAFKSLRIVTVAAIVLCVIYSFIVDIINQSKAGFDGPLAHYSSYTIGLNKIILASFLAFVLVCDFRIRLLPYGKVLLRVVGIACIILSLLGFVYLFLEFHFTGWHRFLTDMLIFQFVYLLISILIFKKSYEDDWIVINSKDVMNV